WPRCGSGTNAPRLCAPESGARHCRVEKAMKVDDEITRLGAIHGHLGLLLPGDIGGSVVGIDPDDIDLVEIGERHTIQARKLATDHKVQKLFFVFSHRSCPVY